MAKYTAYSSFTGFSKNSQTILHLDKPNCVATLKLPPSIRFSDMAPEIPKLVSELHEFAVERGWNEVYTPGNLMLALMAEFGELAELVQWLGDNAKLQLKESKVDKLCQEIADVSIYLLRLSVSMGRVRTMCKMMGGVQEQPAALESSW